jgi:hypothetical protein
MKISVERLQQNDDGGDWLGVIGSGPPLIASID